MSWRRQYTGGLVLQNNLVEHDVATCFISCGVTIEAVCTCRRGVDRGNRATDSLDSSKRFSQDPVSEEPHVAGSNAASWKSTLPSKKK